MSLVPVNVLLQNNGSNQICWVCNNQKSSFSRMIINCNCQPQGVHEDCLIQSIKHIRQTNALAIKQSVEFPEFEYYICPHCEKEVFFRPDLSYRYKKGDFKASEKLAIFTIVFICLVYSGLMVFITIEMLDDPWVFILVDALLLFFMIFSILILRRTLRARFYWLYEGLQLERRNTGLLKENLT